MPPKSVNQTNQTQLIKKTNFQSQGLLKDKSEVKKAGSIEKNYAVHGNWTVDYAKIRLNKFMQDNKLKIVDYKYNITNEGFVAEASIYVPILGKSLTARGSGHGKQSSSTNCALSLVQQLYNLGIIEPFPGSMKKTREIDFEKSYEVNVNPLILKKVHDILQEFGIEPVVKNDVLIKNKTKTSLIYNQVLEKFNETKPNKLTGVIPWSPPQRNWNPWLAKRIDQNPLATATLDKLSEKLAKDKYFKIPVLSEWFNENIAMRSQLPIFAKRNDILDLIRQNKITIIRGSTISGKTSQVCQFIFDEYLKNGRGAYCNIICAQPNSISAINIAKTVAFERKEDLGLSVGYSVTHDDSIFPRSHGAILFCTIDVLLYKLENGVRGISHIIVDEIQERFINSDILMAIFKDMVNYYPSLKVICMSSSLNTDVFFKYFNCCPVIDVEEKFYSVKEYFIEDIVQMLNYQPTHYSNEYNENNKITAEQYENNLNLCVSNKYSPDVRSRVAMISENSVDFNIIVELIKYIEEEINTPGTILIFLESWKLIPLLRSYLNQPGYFKSSKLCILPLDSKLACGKQYKVMEPVPSGVRKVILTTSIAETSITVYDVVFVINCCKQVLNKIYSNSSNFERIWISKANMRQRRSRAGLVKDGVCFHLCSKARYDKMDDRITPEIVYKPLQKVLLIIKLLKLGDVGKFLSKTIEPPPNDAVIEAQVMLKDMKCLGINNELTPLGHIIAKLGIEPQLGRMMVLGNILMQGDALAIITGNHLNRKKTFMFDKSVTAELHPQHSFSGNRCSDHLTFLNAFHKWQSTNNLKIDTEIYCERNKLYEPSLTSIKNTMEQLKNQFIKIGFPEICFERQSFDYGTTTKTRMHNNPILDLVTAILTVGFYPNVCYTEKNRKVFIAGENNTIIHRTSIIMCDKMDFQSPFFVFANKKCSSLDSKLTICKELTMVTPIHLLLFGARKVECIKDKSSSYIHLDDWLTLKMDAVTASAIVALRPAIESLIEHVSKDPKSISMLSEKYIKLINVLKELCNFNCGKFNFSPISFDQGDKLNNMRKFNKTFHKSGNAAIDSYKPNNKREFKQAFDKSHNTPKDSNTSNNKRKFKQAFDKNDDALYEAIPLINISCPNSNKEDNQRNHVNHNNLIVL